MIDTGLAGRVVIVTGGSSGIGRATALRFAREGARVSVWDIKPDTKLAAELKDAGGEGHVARVNVHDDESVETALSEVVERWGAVHVLVNNAGVLRDGMLIKYKDGAVQSLMSDEQFDSVIDVNLKGVFVCARAVAPQLIASGGGAILNATSVVALYGNFGQTNYVATKCGVIGMTKVWARELGRHGVRVNAVAPGFIATEMVSAMPAKILDRMKASTPLGRLGTPDDVANTYLWLASDAASFISGAVISVDGGVVTGTF